MKDISIAILALSVIILSYKIYKLDHATYNYGVQVNERLEKLNKNDGELAKAINKLSPGSIAINGEVK